MPQFVSASRALGRLLSRVSQPQAALHGGGWSIGGKSGSGSMLVGRRSAQVGWLSSMAGVETPTQVVDEREELKASVGGFYNAVQSRGFLGVGDGEEGNPLSKIYEERRVMGYSPEQLFAVVAAVDMYEDFLPWCQKSQIVQRHSDGSFDAELEIGFKFLVESYVSHVELKKPERVKSTVSESGIFDHLINIWEFSPGPIPGTCDLYFYVDFKFQSPLYRQVASMFFKEVVARLVGSFSDRCHLIYGPGIRVLESSYGESAQSHS